MKRTDTPFVRVVIGVLAVSSFLLISPVPGPQPAEAACGTNWTDRKVPPDTIKVLRSKSGKVSEVGFRRYVAIVMASGEWPTTLHKSVLQAGALATKQYGWYYALKGNHRSGYKTSSGTCYDVRDDSKDQVFRPESAEPTTKQKNAIDALWGLSLRKNDKFFLTGYRSGSAKKCASDADGWRLYTKSTKDCAKRLDYDGERILEAYYSPGLDFVWAPGTEPPDEESSDSEDDGDSSQDPDPAEQSDDAGSGGWMNELMSDFMEFLER
jgi:hypothetical protein